MPSCGIAIAIADSNIGIRNNALRAFLELIIAFIV
jgi:hypothetical protein